MNKKNVLSETILIALITINIVSFVNVYLFNIYNSLFFYFKLLSMIIVVLIQNRFCKKDRGLILFVIVFLSYGLFTLFITEGGLGSVLTLFYSILVYFVIKRTDISNKSLKILMMLMILLNLFLVINSPSYYTRWFFNRGDYINSNTIGMVLMYTAIYCSIFLKRLNIKNANLYIVIIYGLSMYGLLNVQARGSLLALTSFIILDTFVSKRVWKNRRFSILFYVVLILTGLSIPYIYTKIYNAGLQFDIPFTEKSLYTGREAIWDNFYYQMRSNSLAVFFGLGSKAELWIGKDLNLHNNYLGVIANFGVIGFVLYYGFWWSQIQALFKKNQLESYQISLLMGFFVILVNGFFEISTLWHVMFFFNFMFLGLAMSGKNPKYSVKAIPDMRTN
jgi:hypothetical protein